MAKKQAAGKADMKEWARGFSLLSDPTRLGILKVLSRGPSNVTALCRSLGVNPPIMSHHLGLLRMGRLVDGARAGKSVVYEANAARLKDLAAALAQLMP